MNESASELHRPIDNSTNQDSTEAASSKGDSSRHTCVVGIESERPKNSQPPDSSRIQNLSIIPENGNRHPEFFKYPETSHSQYQSEAYSDLEPSNDRTDQLSDLKTDWIPNKTADIFSLEEMREQLNQVEKGISESKKFDENIETSQENIKTEINHENNHENTKTKSKENMKTDSKETYASKVSQGLKLDLNITTSPSVKDMADQLNKTEELFNKNDQSRLASNTDKTNSRMVLRSATLNQNQNHPKTGGITAKNQNARDDKSDPKPDNQKKVAESTKKQTLQNYTHHHEDNDIEVTFEVLLSPEMLLHGRTVCMAFGPPLSDWTLAMVQMKQKEGTPVIEPGSYLYMTGVLPLNIKHKCMSIPYKYVIKDEQGNIEWENIEMAYKFDGNINRSFVVPDKVKKFTKYDDVILPKLPTSSYHLQKLGREAAVSWMLSRSNDFNNSKFDFEAALNRLEGIAKSFGSNGMRLCLNDTPKMFFNPQGFTIEYLLQEQIKKEAYNLLKTELNSNNFLKILRLAIYLCLVGATKHYDIKSLDQFLHIFEAFRVCGDLLFDPDQLEQMIDAEVSNQISDALKKLVKDFVDFPVRFEGKEL